MIRFHYDRGFLILPSLLSENQLAFGSDLPFWTSMALFVLEFIGTGRQIVAKLPSLPRVESVNGAGTEHLSSHTQNFFRYYYYYYYYYY